MADFLSAVKSARKEGGEQPAEEILTALKSTQTKTTAASEALDEPNSLRTSASAQKNATRTPKAPSSAEAALQILRSQPELDQLMTILQHFHSHAFQPDFNIHAPGPLQAQVINTIISTTVPDFWPALKRTNPQRLMGCLTSLAGVNAVVARLRFLSSRHVPSSQKNEGSDAVAVGDMLDVAEHLFGGDTKLSQLWSNLQTSVTDSVKREMSWKELVNVVGSGKVVAAAAQAGNALNASESTKAVRKKSSWLANGADYAAWLGRNITTMLPATEAPAGCSAKNSEAAAALLLARGLSLGYPSSLLKNVVHALVGRLVSQDMQANTARSLFEHLPTHAKRSMLEQLLRWLSGMVPSATVASEPYTLHQTQDVSSLAWLISFVVSASSTFDQLLFSLFTDPVTSCTFAIDVRRACLASLFASTYAVDGAHDLLEELMKIFHDQLFADHAPVIQQETVAQTLLLTAGYIHRTTPMALLMTARSSNHMQGVSNRLNSSNAKARWLGMVVGTAVSKLVDKEGSKMDFGTDGMQTKEALWYMGLVNVNDKVGTLKGFETLLRAHEKRVRAPKAGFKSTKIEEQPKLDGKPVFGPPRPPAQTEVIGEKVTELIEDDSEDEDDDLKPYSKPDSDPEDSDEDATLVNRNKARPPVYIRDLMSMLGDDKNHDRFQLALKNAAPLIRRKMNFGGEVKDHAEEIAGMICNLQDPFSTENFDESRLQALIAVLLSDVQTMGPWFSRQAFVGDYSIAQRCVMLSALGLGGRELAGFKNEDSLNPAANNTEFPSKRLPPYLQALYSQTDVISTQRLEVASNDMEHALINPLALQAADHSTSHLNAVKVRKFSSRMEVERTKRKPAPNSLAKVFGEAFFFPLLTHYQRELSTYGTSSVYASVPFLLVTFLKTLALLLHASGPATASLLEITIEFWDLLLSLRVNAVSDISVLQSVLLGLLTLLDVTTDNRRIAQEYPKQLMETQQWVDMVFERMAGSRGKLVNEDHGDDEAKVKTLAAGVLVRVREIIEAYQKELVGYSFS